MTPLRIVFLDRATLPVDVPRPSLPHQWAEYPNTSEHEVHERARDADVIITNKVPLTAEQLAGLPHLKLIAIAATGYNHVDLAACRARGVAVCNVRAYGFAAVAEHAFLLMMALRRQLPAYMRDIAAGEWQRAAGFCLFGAPVLDLAGATLAIVGRGAIGMDLAEKARAFGMNVLFAEHRDAAVVREGYVDFKECLARADVVSLHAPLSDATQHLIGAPELAQMKAGAILINTARGGLVDEAALIDALTHGRIGGAGLDVLSVEPPRDGHPLLDLNLPNLLVTPHIAWASQGAMSNLAQQMIGNIEGFFSGQPRHLLN